MEKIIFFGLVIPIFIFVIYLGVKAIMTGSSAKNSNKLELEDENNVEENSQNNSKNLTKELNNLNELLKSGVLTKDEFEKAKKKILDD
tara:strand:- start:2158 stop:2421 length:264 start_codon:yes stop_codon:yes gene_type:complete